MKNKTGRVRGINKFLINFSFFICIFLTSFSKNEVTTIEALPQREKANLDIEVLKIKTEKITGVIYENENKIIFDFKDLKKAAEKKKIVTDSNNYEIFILENLDNAATYMKKNEKFKMNRVFEQGVKLRNGEKIKLKNISYSLIEQNKEKVLEVSYDLKPETFYLGVLNNKNGMVEKIYRAEFIENKESAYNNFHTYFRYTSNLKDHIIDENRITYENGYYVISLGTISMQQKIGTTQGYDPIPAIGLGTHSDWAYTGSVKNYDNITNEKNTEIKDTRINIGQTIEINPHLIEKEKNGRFLFRNKLPKSSGVDNGKRAASLAVFDKDLISNSITAEIKIPIDEFLLEKIKEYAYLPSHSEIGIIDIPYSGNYTISLIPSSIKHGEGNKDLNIPAANQNFGNVITIPYPLIKFKKKNTPTFEVISAQDLDFGTVLKGDNSKTATSKIIIKNLSSKELKLLFPNGKDNDIVILNNNNITSQITADVSVGAEQKETSTGKSYFMLNGELTNTGSATTEGEHTGQFYLNIELK